MSKEELKVEFPKELPEHIKLAFKIIIIGNSSVGKTCLIKRIIKNEFEENYQTTIGFEFITMNVKINDSLFKLQIWDTCGQEVYSSVIKSFYQNSILGIMVYSIEDKKSFENLDFWLNEVKKNTEEIFPIVLIGNKSDSNNREVSFNEGEDYAKKNNFICFNEASAKNGENVIQIFEKISLYLYNEYKDISFSRSNTFGNLNDDTVKLPDVQTENKKKGCC